MPRPQPFPYTLGAGGRAPVTLVSRHSCFNISEQMDKPVRQRRPRYQRMMAAVGAMVIPRSRRYHQHYDCKPPPIFMLLITAVQVAVYVYYVVDSGAGVQLIIKPSPINSPLSYNPHRRVELWRFFSYMFLHQGIQHIVFNSILQLLLGIPLELVHKGLRVGVIYITGVVAGCLIITILYPKSYILGASAGVYALVAAHVANIVINYTEMEFAGFRVFFFTVLLGANTAYAIYDWFYITQNIPTHVGHLGGFVAGVLLGIVVLRNVHKRSWELCLRWFSLTLLLLLLGGAIGWNIYCSFYNSSYYPRQYVYCCG